MDNTLILYDNDFIEIKDTLENISKVVSNSRLHNINNELVLYLSLCYNHFIYFLEVFSWNLALTIPCCLF